jgi:hypothetical protein
MEERNPLVRLHERRVFDGLLTKKILKKVCVPSRTRRGIADVA